MRMYTKQHQFTCGIDLHAESIYVCVLNPQREAVLHKKFPACPGPLVSALAPYRDDVIIGVESTFNWYWLADVCEAEGLPFVMGHALYMKAVHGTKTKNDRIDSRKIAGLLQGGMFPLAYVYPKTLRSIRDLLRRRTHFMRKRSELLAHIQLVRMQYNLPKFGVRIGRECHWEMVREAFGFDEAVAQNINANLETVAHYNDLLKTLENEIERMAERHWMEQRKLLETIPGMGGILSLNVVCEVGDIGRFDDVRQFASYARLIKPKKTSAGKVVAKSQGKMGNGHLKWTFNQAALGFAKYSDWGKPYKDNLKRRYGKAKANGIMAHRLGRAAYFVLTRKEPFSRKLFEKS